MLIRPCSVAAQGMSYSENRVVADEIPRIDRGAVIEWIADQALRPILSGFEAKYPFVKPQYVRDDPPQQLQKVMAESRANRMVVDVLESTGLEVPVRAALFRRLRNVDRENALGAVGEGGAKNHLIVAATAGDARGAGDAREHSE